jgi:DNA primase
VISREDIDRVVEATDLVALVGERVQLRQKGRDFWACCPFHNEKTPSFKVDAQSQFYHCFGCGEGGNAISFIEKMDNLTFPEAMHYLADRANIEIHDDAREGGVDKGKQARLYAICEATSEFYHMQLMRVKADGNDKAREYLGGRGLGGSIARDWKLGYAPGHTSLMTYLSKKGFTRDEMIDVNVARVSSRNNQVYDRFYERVMFPICDIQGRTIAFGGRVIGTGEPKYLNSSDTPLFRKRSNLYAIDKAKASITSTGDAIIVEGYTDVIAMHTAGFTNTVATLGTALTPQHIKLLTRFAKRIIYLFDGDEAGQRAATRASELITSSVAPEAGTRQVDLMVAVLPGGADPAEYCASAGADGMRAVLNGAEPLLKFAIDRKLGAYRASGISASGQRSRALDDALRILLPIKGSIIVADYMNYIADILNTPYEVVKDAFDKIKTRPQREYDDGALDAGVGAGVSADVMDKTATIAREPLSPEAEKLMELAKEEKRLASEVSFKTAKLKHMDDAGDEAATLFEEIADLEKKLVSLRAEIAATPKTE